jgi:hypothetical protein
MNHSKSFLQKAGVPFARSLALNGAIQAKSVTSLPFNTAEPYSRTESLVPYCLKVVEELKSNFGPFPASHSIDSIHSQSLPVS